MRLRDVAFDVFVSAVERPLRPGDDFAPWLAEMVAERAGAVDERRWELAMAIAAIDPLARRASATTTWPVPPNWTTSSPGTNSVSSGGCHTSERPTRSSPRSPIQTCGSTSTAGFVERVVEAVVG